MSFRGLIARTQKWLAPGNRHEFEVIQPFAARSAIADAERVFNQGERVICTEPGAPTVMIETGGAFYFVDRTLFETRCRAVKA